MKKHLFLFCMVIFTGTICFAQNAVLPRLAVVKFTGDATERDAKRVRDMEESVMIDSGHYTIVSTDDIDQILEQQKIALSSIGSEDNITKLKRENIQYIVTGTVNREAAESFVSLRMLDVTNAKFMPNSPRGVVNMTSMTTIYQGVGAIAAAFLASGDKVQSGNNAARSGGGGQVYKIGDFGPAGGIVFYDKGVFSAGWRYLEAAPAETEWSGVQWGAYVKDVSGTSLAIGSGKRNTQVIVDRLRQLNETGRAAQLCTTLDFDGFKDWFLPSWDELNLMYTNLKAKGLGGFQNAWYWSSSEINTNIAWLQIFSDGLKTSIYGKDITIFVRAVRAF
ncbi:hypothetical protein AGMMS49944_23410 [Spirochaetia bacterium]|nr:hypothetical protein AGMMS49944_23410 [Spirochaetia bacterium]